MATKQEQIMAWLLGPCVTLAPGFLATHTDDEVMAALEALARKAANPTAQASAWFREARRYAR